MTPTADLGAPWLTCECCGSTDDETTNGRLCEDDEYVNLCDGCVAALSPNDGSQA